MKHKNNIIIFALLLLSMSASAQIQFTAGLNYESGVPSGAPSSTGSRIRVNLATGRAYIWNQAGTNWRVLAQGIDIVAGCSAPLYTPGYGQSLFAVNGCASPELYYYTGSAWVQISGAGGTTYYAGEGIDITNDTISIDTVQRLSFRTDQTYSDGIGTLSWDDTDGTLQLGLKGGNVSLQIGQESVQLVKHADNTGLTNGKVVYLTGSSGGNLTVRYAQANAESTSANTFGLMTEDATGGNKAFCTTFGLVRNINTSNLTEGGMVWLSKDTAGAMTAVRPTAPNHGVEIGFCVTKHATNGVIFVTVQNGYELNELHNVYAPSPTNGQVLTYDLTDSRWEAATVADQSATNEIQTIDTFSLSGQTLSASLSSDAQAAKTVTLPIIDVVAGTNVTVTKSNGVATVSATGGGGSGTVTGTGVAGRAAFWRSSSEISSDVNFAWDSTNVQLNINAPSAPTGKLNVKGGGTLTTTNFRLTNGNNTEILKVLDNGNTNIGTGFNWDNTNGRLGLNASSPAVTLDVVGRMNIGGNFSMTTNTPFSVIGSQSNRRITNSTGALVNNQVGYLSGVVDLDGSQGFSNGAALNFILENRNTGSSNSISGARATLNNLSSASLDAGFGVWSRIDNASVNTVANMRTYLADYNNSSASSVVTNLYLFDANLRTNSGVITNTYGIYVGDITKGTQTNTPFSFYASDPDAFNYFAGRTGIGTTSPNVSAALDVTSTTQGILFPRMTTAQRDLINTPANGLVIYNTTASKFQGYAGGAWVDLH